LKRTVTSPDARDDTLPRTRTRPLAYRTDVIFNAALRFLTTGTTGPGTDGGD
jgi:hypothetical protein